MLELAQRGSLDDILYSDTVQDKLDFFPYKHSVAFDICKGMAYLHHDLQPPMLHRDLKPSNVLISANWRAKLTDFGTVAECVSNVTRVARHRRKLAGRGHGLDPKPTEGQFFSNAFGDSEEVQGTLAYMSPESMRLKRGETLSTGQMMASDVWSFGVTLWEVIQEKQPDLLSLHNVEDGGPASSVYLSLFDQGKTLPDCAYAPDWSSTLTAQQSPVAARQLMPVWARAAVLSCLQIDWYQRPTFATVLQRLVDESSSSLVISQIVSVAAQAWASNEDADTVPLLPMMRSQRQGSGSGRSQKEDVAYAMWTSNRKETSA